MVSLKLLRVLRRGVHEIYLVYGDGEVYLGEGDPVDLLRAHSKGELSPRRRAELNLGSLLESRDPVFKVAKPFDPVEVWGAGITYQAARARYVEEDVAILRGRPIYELVHESPRPELFLKDSMGRRCVAHQDPIGVRSDSTWTLPEAELGVVVGEGEEILGYTVANDVTARDIEAENPLYLPQAKTFAACCSFGPFVVTPDEVKDPYSLSISLKILRGGRVVFEGEGSTSRMSKRIDHVLGYLARDNPLPRSLLLMTGAAVLPGKGVGLEHGDLVVISIERVGTLVNTVAKLGPGGSVR